MSTKTQLKIDYGAKAKIHEEATELAAVLFRARLQKRMTQRQAAERIGCHGSSIGHLESASALSGIQTGFPSMELVRKACDLYGLQTEHYLIRFRALRKKLDKKGEMFVTSGLGKSHAPRNITFKGIRVTMDGGIGNKDRTLRNLGTHDAPLWCLADDEPLIPRDVDAFEYPELLVRPGVDPRMLAVLMGLVGTFGLCVWQVVRILGAM